MSDVERSGREVSPGVKVAAAEAIATGDLRFAFELFTAASSEHLPSQDSQPDTQVVEVKEGQS